MFVYLRNVDDPDEALDAKVEPRWARPAIRRLRSPVHGPIDLGPDLLLRRVRRPRWRAGCWGSTRSTSPTSRRPRTTPTRCSTATAETAGCPTGDADDDALRRCSTGRAAALRRDPRLPQPVGAFDAAAGDCAPAIRDRTKVHHHLRLRAALPALDRPVPQGRAADRASSSSSSTTARRTSRSPGRLHFEHAEERGRRRATCKRCATTASRPSACGWRATRPRRWTPCRERIEGLLRGHGGEPGSPGQPARRRARAAPGPSDDAGDLRRHGDLSNRKLLPAIYNLAHEGSLPERFNLIGVSRSRQVRTRTSGARRESIQKYSRTPARPSVLDALLGRCATSPAVRRRRRLRPHRRGCRRFDEQAAIPLTASSTCRPRRTSSR